MPHADRLAKVDAEGVMRWTDDGSEVALFGVNYYPPFTVDYKSIKEKGLDFSQVMREDVAHFRRLGLTCIRIHCFDRQFSAHDGAFLNNHHVALLDELIDLCAKNGIYTGTASTPSSRPSPGGAAPTPRTRRASPTTGRCAK